MLKIEVPSLTRQHIIIETEKAIQSMRENTQARLISPAKLEFMQTAHLLPEDEGWIPPHHDIVADFFEHYARAINLTSGLDNHMAHVLGLSSGRRIREYKSGKFPIPYGVWRKFLVLTGRVVQEVPKAVFIVERV